MTNDDKFNLYNSVDSMNLTQFEQYKYLTENDTDIVQLKQRVKKIEMERKLSSTMNDTKWLKLQNGIATLPFPPAYNVKLIQGNEIGSSFDDCVNEPFYFGDWSNFWEEGMPIFFTIEWLEIRPKFSKFQGRLVSPKILDETVELITLLENLNIPFEEKNGSIIIYGYR